MRLCRFGGGRLGIVEGASLRDVTVALDVLPSYRYPLPSCDPLIANLDGFPWRAQLPALIAAGADGVQRWLDDGLEAAMQFVNTWSA